MRKIWLFLLFGLLIAMTAQPSLAKACESSISLIQLTPEAVCDGSPFSIRLENSNGWAGYEEAFFSSSEGISFNSFPHVMFNTDVKQVDMIITCKDVKSGTIGVSIVGTEGKSCDLKLELNSIYLPVKNADGETVVTDISTIKKSENSDRTFRMISIGLIVAFAIAAIVLLHQISKAMKERQHRNHRKH